METLRFYNETLRFYNPTRGNISFDETLAELVKFILEDQNSVYAIGIGTDSPSSENPEFVTAVTIHRVGQGGRFFITRFLDRARKFRTVRERIYQETMLSLNLAMIVWQGIEEKLQAVYPLNRDDLKVHLDIGNKGATKEMIQEMVGMVKGNGFEAEIKPAAYAASTVAHEYTR